MGKSNKLKRKDTCNFQNHVVLTMKKVAILTFHWATNYGAVLQACALQTAIMQYGLAKNVEIIDYYPDKYKINFINCFNSLNPITIIENFKNLLKEKRIEKFRKKHLIRSKHYSSDENLKLDPPDADVFICGSDQIWNSYFTQKGEDKLTLTYFLDFTENKRRLAYAASFGSEELPKNIEKEIKAELQKFSFIGMRENSGVAIVKSLGIDNVQLVCDPTILIFSKDWNALCANPKIKGIYYSLYILRRQSHTIKKLINTLRLMTPCNVKIKDIDNLEVEEWLGYIKNCRVFITNSYHGLVMALKFKTDFVFVLEQGARAGMNDRIITLLELIGLKDRIISEKSNEEINDVLQRKIEWESVYASLSDFANNSIELLKKAIQSNI